MDVQRILSKLPYQEPFLFVDGISRVSDDDVEGHYTFKKESAFYQGHFKDYPVTPGVLLTECCAQIGLVCLGIHLLSQHLTEKMEVAMTSSEMEFLKPVFPGETIKVQAEKRYFRFQKLKCTVKMYDASGDMVCHGTLAGMIKTTGHD
ncbi:3-hydroxyacyl-(Acyl-carrier-protein) dehydratase [Croceitalea dokdonensis DOKDO 023]|uniref:3-hydroxyacyl-(Acyl-carrier-protein) dehydratase n=1 Tax=Croceitalea dokdonensis DOKDO 023 TaxID=1300341 RepID=A0A0P7AYW5_9FLAO|nr:3-hydroxyacyl-ACP dehydratase FabZ family protein [Croceitalea dokdonensis]KPM33397.1 3-hydroxyacyl-(Acyl-carrier-protein) dehydratase [Croceitalea dokdonensis DOKDO 023]